MMTIRHFVNGLPADSVSVLDRGLRYGDGCFETMAVYAGKIPLWNRHYNRLHNACVRLKIEPNFDRESLEKELANIISDTDRAIVRLTVTRGQDATGYQFDPHQTPTRIISLLPRKDTPRSYEKTGVEVCICNTRLSRNPALAGIKHLNRLEQVLARSEWSDEYAEGLLCDDVGNVIEGTITNLFIVENGALYTPELTECGVAGVMRAEVLACAQNIGIAAKEVAIDRARLLSSNECFLTNAVIGIWPIKQIDGKNFAVGSVTRTLQEELMKIITSQ